MKKVTINNVSMPAIGIGTWNMGNSLVNRSTEIKAIQTAIDAGAQAIDTAEMYGDGRSEALVAEAIKPYSREKLFLIDKVLPSNASKKRQERLKHGESQTSMSVILKNYGVLKMALIALPTKISIISIVGELNLTFFP